MFLADGASLFFILAPGLPNQGSPWQAPYILWSEFIVMHLSFYLGLSHVTFTVLDHSVSVPPFISLFRYLPKPLPLPFWVMVVVVLPHTPTFLSPLSIHLRSIHPTAIICIKT